jgi:hypothetical protein
LERALRGDESEKREALLATAVRKLGMFHRQCTQGVSRLATTTS